MTKPLLPDREELQEALWLKLTPRLEQLIANSDWNAKSLSLAAGLNETAVRDIVRGISKSPRIDTIHRLSTVLGENLFECLVGDLSPK